jgi:hypothetical protein
MCQGCQGYPACSDGGGARSSKPQGSEGRGINIFFPRPLFSGIPFDEESFMSRIVPALFLAAALLPCSVFCQTESAAADSSSRSGSDADAAPELRKPRIWALSAEVGLNSLSSLVGPVATWYAAPNYALDLGLGLSSAGWRPGLRARYLFSLEKTAYFGAIGLKYATGSDGKYAKVKDPETEKDIEIKVDGSGYVDASVGVEYLADNGFLVLANAGYSQLWGGQNYHFRPGAAVSDEAEKLYKAVLGSGIMLSVSLGKAF